MKHFILRSLELCRFSAQDPKVSWELEIGAFLKDLETKRWTVLKRWMSISSSHYAYLANCVKFQLLGDVPIGIKCSILRQLLQMVTDRKMAALEP